MDTTHDRDEARPDAVGTDLHQTESVNATGDDQALQDDLEAVLVRRNLSSQGRPLARYKMDHGDRGYALIFNNREFGDKSLTERKGTDMDLKKMISLLRDELGFKRDQVKFEHNVTKQRMIDLIVNVAAKDFTNCDCFVCVILSYGTKEGEIYGADGGDPIHLEELKRPLKGTEFQASKSLVGKPKMFFVQACPHEKGDEGRDDDDAGSDAESEDDEEDGERIASEADFLTAWSSVPGSLGRKGSSFIQTLNEVVKERRDTDDLLSLLTKVNNGIAAKFGDANDVEVPYFKSMLTKKLFFSNAQ